MWFLRDIAVLSSVRVEMCWPTLPDCQHLSQMLLIEVPSLMKVLGGEGLRQIRQVRLDIFLYFVFIS